MFNLISIFLHKLIFKLFVCLKRPGRKKRLTRQVEVKAKCFLEKKQVSKTKKLKNHYYLNVFKKEEKKKNKKCFSYIYLLARNNPPKAVIKVAMIIAAIDTDDRLSCFSEMS